MDTTWQHTLDQLIEAGAELTVTDADGTTILNAPLARAWRLDPDDPGTLWLRPLAPPIAGDDGTEVFALSQCRRRALPITDVRTDTSGTLTLGLGAGQHARIQHAAGSAAAALDSWDTFVGARLTANEEAALDALAEDSWTGRYA